MESYNTKDHLDRPEDILSEYKDLIDLAQHSADTIDAMQDAASRSKSLSILVIIASYAFLVVPSIVLWQFFEEPRFSIRSSFGIFMAISAFFSFFAAILTLNIVFSRLKRERYDRQTLQTEIEIHQRLLSLLEEQKNRVQILGILSPVMTATLEMKVMRLYRRYKNNYGII